MTLLQLKNVQVKNLRPHHLGVKFEDIGRLRVVAMDADGYTLHTNRGLYWLGPDDIVTYPIRPKLRRIS